MLRENLVGMIVKFDSMTNELPTEWLLVEFVGEGAESVVYAIAPPDDSSKRSQVLKFPKGMPMFEMETPHYSLRLHEDLYPDHPLRMSAGRRLEMLTTEMLVKIDYGHLIFRIGLYRELLEKTLVVLQSTCSEAFEQNAPLGPILDGSPTRGLLDDNFVEYLDGLLGDDLIMEQYRPVFEQLREDIESAIIRWQSECNYSPLSRNPFVNLLGLYAEGFINLAELQHVSSSPGFVSRLHSKHADGLFDLITTLYFHLKGQLEGEGEQTRQREARGVDVPLIGCDLLQQADNGRLAGIAQLWKTYFLLLGEWEFREVESLLGSALENLQEPDNMGNRHDTLMLLSDLYMEINPTLSARYQSESAEIRRHLGIVDE